MNDISPWHAQRTLDAAPAEPAYTPPSEEAHLRDYWRTIVKYRRMILILFLTVFCLGAYIISGATPMYTASSKIRIDPQQPQFIRVEEVMNLQVQSGDYHATQHEMMRSRALAARVIAEAGLETNQAFINARVVSPDPIRWVNAWFFRTIQSIVNLFTSFAETPKKQPPPAPSAVTPLPGPGSAGDVTEGKLEVKPAVNPALVGRYLGFLRVEPLKGTRLVGINFTTPDPHLSQTLANAHAQTFLRMNMETRFDLTKEARAFIEKKLAELRSKIDAAESDLTEFRKAHGVVSMDRGENLIVDRMVTLNSNLTSVRVKRIELESLRQMLDNKNPAELSEVMNNGSIQQYRAAIETLTAEQVKLSTVFKPDHPKMIEIGTRISETKQRMKSAIDEVVRRIQMDYESARNREASLEAEASRQKQAAIDLKGLGARYGVLQGEVEANRNIYRSLLQRLSETTIANDLPVSNMQLVELADSPGFLSSSGQQLKLLLSTIIGALFLAIAMAFCLEYFDSRVANSNDVWRFLCLPTLGVVPDLRLLHRSPKGYLQYSWNPLKRLTSHWHRKQIIKDLLITAYPESMVAESYRSIRTALLFSQPDAAPRTVVMTSAGPAEGKTMTTLNVAIALAQSGKNVLLIDADLRKGRCHKLLHRPNEKGLSNYLVGSVTLEECLQPTAIKGLTLFARGQVPPNPPDLVGSNRMKEMLAAMRKRFEFVLVDASPVIGVTDAELLSTCCEAVVFVMHSQKTSRFAARQALQTLDGVRARILGVVLNGIDIRSPDYANYRYYYTSYYAAVTADNEKAVEELPVEDQQSNPRELELAWHELVGTTPKSTFEYLTARLSEAVGPMAPLIVQDHVALMGESLEAFPNQRLKELCERICQEISNDELRERFEKSLS